MDTSLTILRFFALLIVLAKCFGDLAALFGFPSVFGELLVGLVLGPTFIDVFQNFSPGTPTLTG